MALASDEQALVTFTLSLARSVGELLQNRPSQLHVGTKTTATDVVTQMDEMAETAIVSAISKDFPHDSIVGEEGAAVSGSSEFRWIIDPLDGTVNYLYGLPAWSISIARVNTDTGETQIGVVHAPDLNRTYWGVNQNGSFLEMSGEVRRLSVSPASELAAALLGTGFGYATHRREGQARVLTKVLPKVRDIRRIGSCAIDLCFVAEGTLDGFYERGVNVWDHSAGALIAREAGAIVSGLHGELESDKMIVVANPHIHRELVGILESVHADSDPVSSI